MKNFKIAFAVLAAVLLSLTLVAAPSSGISPVSVVPTGDDDGANLELRPPGGTYDNGQTIEILANFQSTTAGQAVTLYKETSAGSNTYAVDEVDSSANSSGNAYFHPEVDNGPRKYFAQDASNRQTEVTTITGTVPPPSSGTLNPTTDNGKTWTAKFTPAVSGKATRLEAQEICTYETDETNPAEGEFNKDVSQADCQGPWATVATSTQNSSGNTTFTPSERLEVKHKYRAVSGSTVSPIVSYAVPLPTDPYGIDTGLSELHFNTYEGDDVNTRSRYFEGEFSMTASEKSVDVDGNGPKVAAQCAAQAPITKSELKGRGNFSWSFPKKSFTLKIDKKKDLCGLGVSKKYALIANDFDKSLLRNTLASYVGQKFSKMGWTPKIVPVDFYMNGNFRGSYILIERITIQGSVTDPTYANRVNIHELNGDDETEQAGEGVTGGYILEWDYRKGADYEAYLPYGSGAYIGVKEPENDYDREGDNTGEGISSAQKSYINGYLNDADDALRGSNYRDNTNGWQKYIDKDSAVDYYIAMEYMKPFDGNMWTSTYMYKPRGEKIHFGPMWDFDLSAADFTRDVPNLLGTSGWYLRNNQNTEDQQPLSGKTWFNRLNEDPEFTAAVAARWNEIEGTMSVTNLIDTQKSLISQSATANFKKWPYSGRVSPNQVIKGSSSEDVSFLRSYATGRKSWINGQF